MKTMSIAKQIRIQRKQDKNRMAGKTFNPSGITSEQITSRENTFISEMESKTQQERQKYWDKVLDILKEREQNNIHCSWSWDWCAFQRHFVSHGKVYK